VSTPAATSTSPSDTMPLPRLERLRTRRIAVRNPQRSSAGAAPRRPHRARRHARRHVALASPLEATAAPPPPVPSGALGGQAPKSTRLSLPSPANSMASSTPPVDGPNWWRERWSRQKAAKLKRRATSAGLRRAWHGVRYRPRNDCDLNSGGSQDVRDVRGTHVCGARDVTGA
jgi:hypothetical protein